MLKMTINSLHKIYHELNTQVQFSKHFSKSDTQIRVHILILFNILMLFILFFKRLCAR